MLRILRPVVLAYSLLLSVNRFVLDVTMHVSYLSSVSLHFHVEYLHDNNNSGLQVNDDTVQCHHRPYISFTSPKLVPYEAMKRPAD